MAGAVGSNETGRELQIAVAIGDELEIENKELKASSIWQ
jgi:hypothetical protein